MANGAIRPDNAIFGFVITSGPRWGIKQLFYPRAIFGMDRFEKKLKTGFYVPRGQTENSEVFQGPEHFSRNRVVGPTARVAESLRLSEIGLAAFERCSRSPAFGNLGGESRIEIY